MRENKKWLLAIITAALFWGTIALFFKYPRVFFVWMFCVAVIFTVCACKRLLIDEVMK